MYETTFGGFTTYATFGNFTTGGYYFEECDAWAAQVSYCFFYGYYEAFYQYQCNQYIAPYYYSYGDACGAAGLAFADCLSTLDCDEWGNIGLGTDCDDENDAIDDNCAFP